MSCYLNRPIYIFELLLGEVFQEYHCSAMCIRPIWTRKPMIGSTAFSSFFQTQKASFFYPFLLIGHFFFNLLLLSFFPPFFFSKGSWGMHPLFQWGYMFWLWQLVIHTYIYSVRTLTKTEIDVTINTCIYKMCEMDYLIAKICHVIIYVK